MTPIRLKMQAFGPYQGAVEIAFSGLRGKLFLITGSTGGGKTTILDAICFALFCRATGGRRTWQDMRNLSAGEDVPTMVDFEFSLGEEQYRFQRSWRWHKVRGSGRMEMRDEHQCSRRNGEQWELLASGAESRVREYAQRLLGLTCEQFSQVIVLPQGEFRKLLLSNSTEKSKIFQTLFQTEKWERITKCAQSMAEDLEQRCGGLLSARQAVLESEGVQASEELELLRKATEEEYEQSIAAVKKTENDLENISNIIQKVNGLKETETVFRRLQKQLAQAAAEKRALEQKRQEAVKAAAGLARLEEEKAAGLQLAAKHQEQMETLTKLKSLAAEKERLEKEIASQKEQRLEWEQKALSAAENVERGRAYLRELNDKLKALPEASRSFQELKTAFELLKQWEEGKRRLAGEQSALQKAEEILEQSRVKLSALQESLERAQQKAREDMAGHLASGLRDGEPCPVCGAVHHPSPASLEIGVTVTPEEEKRLKRLVKEAQEAFTSAQGAFTKHQGQRELLEKNVRESERRIADFPYPPEKLPALLAAAEKKLAGLQKAGELLPQGEKRLAQRENEEKTAKLQADRSKERQAQWENKLSAVSAEISSLWGALPEERQGQSLDQAEQGLRNSLTEVQARLQSLRKKIQETQEASAKTGEALAAAAAGEKALRNQTHEAKEQWEAAGREIPGEMNQEALEQEYASLQEESRESLQKTGRLLQKRKSLEQAAAKIRDLEEESKAVQEEYSKTERIARFFSGKNPMNVPLKMFVLGVMLDDILSRANVYFTTLSGGRYQLSRKREGASRGYSGLDLEIYDAYSGGGRNVDTLSGGELFLASLSLAFGLSDVVQSYSGGVRLESIFIDEGFGTLDEETLNTAMKALFEIQKSGRTVGIISHVAELKSRIPAQIRILDDHKIKVVLP